MSQNPNSQLLKYIAIGVVLGGTYFTVQYLANKKKTASTNLELTKKILKEVRYQVLANCITYAEQVIPQLQANKVDKNIDIELRTKLAQIYEQKQDLILAKYVVPREEYAEGLRRHGKDSEIVEGSKEIFTMLESIVNMQYPDLTVHPDVSNLNSSKEILGIYGEMCLQIALQIWKKLDKCKQENPAFDSKNDLHFKKAIKEISIYDFKIEFLSRKGYRKQWGCPNYNFFKVLQNLKRINPDIKKEAFYVEKSYEVVISKVSTQPSELNQLKIRHLMEETIEKLKKPAQVPSQASQSKAQPQPQAQSPPAALFSSSVAKKAAVVKPVVEEEEFDMDKLMAQQLLSRSQQQPKPEIKVEQEKLPKIEFIQQKIEQPQEEIKIIQQKKLENIQLKEQAAEELKPQVIENAEIPVSVEAPIQENAEVPAVQNAEVPVSAEQTLIRDEEVNIQLTASNQLKVEQKVQSQEKEIQVHNEPEQKEEQKAVIEQEVQSSEPQHKNQQKVEIQQEPAQQIKQQQSNPVEKNQEHQAEKPIQDNQ